MKYAEQGGRMTKDKAKDWARHHANSLFSDGGWDTCDAVEMISDNSFDAGYKFAKSESNDKSVVSNYLEEVSRRFCSDEYAEHDYIYFLKEVFEERFGKEA